MHRKSKTWKSRQSVVCLSLERHPLHVAGMLILGESSGQFLATGESTALRRGISSGWSSLGASTPYALGPACQRKFHFLQRGDG